MRPVHSLLVELVVSVKRQFDLPPRFRDPGNVPARTGRPRMTKVVFSRGAGI